MAATGALVRAVQGVFGTLPDGASVDAVTLMNANGIRVTLIALGARVRSVDAPDRCGTIRNIVPGWPDLAGYVHDSQYFGATIGRVADRIAGGEFTLDGKRYTVPPNDGRNALHGGPGGFSSRLWKVLAVREDASRASVTFQYVSPDGDMGFPGTLIATATYTLTQRNSLRIDYRATTDRPTLVNMTNHTYWNLAGEGSGSVMGQVMQIRAAAYAPFDANLVPTGSIAGVQGTPFDFRRPKPIGRDIRDRREPQLAATRGYDQNWIVDPRAAGVLRIVARAEDPACGRVLTLGSNQPGLQFYTGNFLDGKTPGTTGHAYAPGDAFALEPQGFPDAQNHDGFPSSRLDPGQTYHNAIVYRFSTKRA